MSTLDILKETRRLLEAGWCQGTFSTDKDGKYVALCNDNVANYCLAGALAIAKKKVEASGDDLFDAQTLIIKKARGEIFTFNDSSTKEEVLALVDEIIKEAEPVSEVEPEEEAKPLEDVKSEEIKDE